MSQATWESIIHHWPMTIFVPGVLVVLAAIALIGRMFDKQ